MDKIVWTILSLITQGFDWKALEKLSNRIKQPPFFTACDDILDFWVFLI